MNCPREEVAKLRVRYAKEVAQELLQLEQARRMLDPQPEQGTSEPEKQVHVVIR